MTAFPYSMIDSHIHLDMYTKDQVNSFVETTANHGVQHWITVSRHLESCQLNEELRQLHPHQISPAFGFHPEQELPTEEAQQQLIDWIVEHHTSMVAIGEVGLPYYTRQELEVKGQRLELAPYLVLLERFVQLAAQYDLPIILHAVYEDAEPVLDLLERHSIRRAHFHWFKGAESSIQRILANRYYISVTPDIVYEEEIQALARRIPLDHIMIETDGPWPFEGPFEGTETHPSMMAHTLHALSQLSSLTPEDTAQIILKNTREFYAI